MESTPEALADAGQSLTADDGNFKSTVKNYLEQAQCGKKMLKSNVNPPGLPLLLVKLRVPASSSSSASSASSFSSAEVKERKLVLATTKVAIVSTTVTIDRDEDSPLFKWCFAEDGILGLGPQFPSDLKVKVMLVYSESEGIIYKTDVYRGFRAEMMKRVNACRDNEIPAKFTSREKRIMITHIVAATHKRVQEADGVFRAFIATGTWLPIDGTQDADVKLQGVPE
jgi:hypothetical protein